MACHFLYIEHVCFYNFFFFYLFMHIFANLSQRCAWTQHLCPVWPAAAAAAVDGKVHMECAAAVERGNAQLYHSRLGSVQRAQFHWFTMLDYRAANLRAAPTTAGMMTLTARKAATSWCLGGSVSAYKTFHCFCLFIVTSLNVI